jgi:hypothetical protein
MKTKDFFQSMPGSGSPMLGSRFHARMFPEKRRSDLSTFLRAGMDIRALIAGRD